MMKYIAASSITFVVGLIVGGIHPRMKLQEHENNPLVIPVEKNCSSTVGTDLAKLMGQGTTSQPSTIKDRPKTAEEIIETNPKAAELAAEIDQEQERMQEQLSEEIENLPNEELDAARGALELRSVQARAALIEGAEPTQEQLTQIDKAINDMNESLLQIADELADTLESEGEPSRRDAMAFAAEALDTMLSAEDTIRSALDSEQIENLDDGSLDPFSYVSPELIDVLQSVDRQ